MSEIQVTQPRALIPRRLDQQETLNSLNQWIITFKNFYRRCSYYGYFLQPGIRWNADETDRGLMEEQTGLKRSPALLSSDLEGFLQTLSGYLPFDYVASKLCTETTDMKSVWQIIYEIYDLEITTTNFLDYASMTRNQDESYRGFYNRLVGFVRQHLPQTSYEADGVKSPTTGEHLSISLLDAVTIHWLLTIDRRLISIVKTELATDLKTKRMCQLVKQIAPNIDEWLQRYNQNDMVSTVTSQQATQVLPATSNETPIMAIVQRLEKLEMGAKERSYRGRFRPKSTFRKPVTCGHCTYINRQLGANLDTKHSPKSCPKQQLSINILEMTEQEEIDSTDDVEYDGGEVDKYQNSSSFKILQKIDSPELKTKPSVIYETEPVINNSPLYKKDNVVYNLSDRDNCLNEKLADSILKSDDLESQTLNHTIDKEQDTFSASLLKLRNSTYQWGAVQKCRSPKLVVHLKSVSAEALLDSGAELNVLDSEFAARAGIKSTCTTVTAKAANKQTLNVKGQSAEQISLSCQTEEGDKVIDLGFVLIVEGLGVACIIGQPGIVQNNIIYLPKKKIILLAGGDTIHQVPWNKGAATHTIARSDTNVILSPNEDYCFKLPPIMSQLSHVAVTPRPSTLSWLKPSVLPVTDNSIYLRNTSDCTITIKKQNHLADIRQAVAHENDLDKKLPPAVSHSGFIPDDFQYRDFAKQRVLSKSALQQIQIDPDSQLSQSDRDIFVGLHNKYVHLFSTQPGKYNGHFGYVENRLQFSSLPAPNSKTYIPNYSPTMNKLLAEKMDNLEQWGVLVPPESVGVQVQFVSPSMLVPKTDSPDYRLVTDFAALNVYLKRVPNTSATIAQARARIARAKFVVHLDLANYFYQSGLQHGDIQYLGTVHPFKGLRVYTCDPQGLKGASERSYEKLLRIYGDLIQENRLAQMADGLHVLGMSIPELARNYEEVLRRAELCNLTFKPSKVCVCPRTINLFGWVLDGEKWLPTQHTISTLTSAPVPKTVKQMRSFLGSFKQLSASLPKYAETIYELEKVAAGRKSGERIVWTDTLQECFQRAKQLASNPVGLAEPRPTDTLRTYSDYSAETKAVGGRLTILRKQEDGSTVELVGGFFSAILAKHKQRWLPCEGEACAIRLVLEHFQHHIRESENQTIHYTDSMPCVLAWRRSLKGAFSASARIATFLTGLSTLSVELHHKPGKMLHTSDYASRHPAVCTFDNCQICRFVREWEDAGDLASKIRHVSIEDIRSGRMLMPLTQKIPWKNIQNRDSVHNKLRELITTQQLPNTKKTNGPFTKLKLLHNKYTEGKLFIDKDSMFMVRTPLGHFNGAAISVPHTIYPGLVSALHIQLDHPSRNQLSDLLDRYFYTPGGRAIVEDISENCVQCAAMKTLPKVLLKDTTEIPAGMATDFAADVIERANQKILVVKENLSSFTRACLIPDQTATTLRNALLSLILEIIPESGANVRVDSAPAFQSLSTECQQNDSLLNKYKIKITLGRTFNKNKNPTAEICNKELQKEVLKLTGSSGKITELQLIMVLRNMNNRIRYNGHTSKEIIYRRDILNNKPIPINDDKLRMNMENNRSLSSQASQQSKSKTHQPTPTQSFNIGDLVFIRDGKSKNSPRDTYIIEDIQDKFYIIRKFNTKLRQRVYKALADEIIKIPNVKNTLTTEVASDKQLYSRAGRPIRKAAMKSHNILTIADKPKKKLTCKPGWLPEDQLYEEVVYITQHGHVHEDPESSESSCADTETEGPTSNSDVELLWDSSPEQYSLTPSPPTHDVNLTPESPNSAPTRKTTRRNAISERALVRTNAFRNPPDEVPVSEVIPTMHFRRSRIPTPTTPSNMDLNQVADISLLPTPLNYTYNLRHTAYRQRGRNSEHGAPVKRTREERK